MISSLNPSTLINSNDGIANLLHRIYMFPKFYTTPRKELVQRRDWLFVIHQVTEEDPKIRKPPGSLYYRLQV